MTDTIKERCCKALLAKFAAISAITGLTVVRNRDTRVERFPTLVQYDKGAQDDRVEWMGPAAEWRRLAVAVDCFVTGATETARDAAFDALYLEAVKAATSD